MRGASEVFSTIPRQSRKRTLHHRPSVPSLLHRGHAPPLSGIIRASLLQPTACAWGRATGCSGITVAYDHYGAVSTLDRCHACLPPRRSAKILCSFCVARTNVVIVEGMAFLRSLPIEHPVHSWSSPLDVTSNWSAVLPSTFSFN